MNCATGLNLALFFRLALAVACLSGSSIAAAQGSARGDAAYPNRPIKLIVAFPPGGGADLTARIVAQKLSESLGQPMLVENRAGANGIVGASAVAKSAPDGYTLLLTDRGALGINPSIYKSLPYDPTRDFAYVGITVFGPYVMVVNPSLPARTLTEFMQLARSKPGAINYGSMGIGSMVQFNVEALNARMGTRLSHVPYKGGGAAVAAVVSGEIGMTIVAVPGALGFIRDGRARALALGADKRSVLLPDVPTLAEAGGGEDVLVPTYFGIAAPTETPRAIITKLNAEIRRALGQADVATRLIQAGLEPAGSSPEEMLDLVKRDIVRFAALVKTVGITPE